MVLADSTIRALKPREKADATVRKRAWFLSFVDRASDNRPIADIEPIEALEAVRPCEAAKNDERAQF